MGESLTGKSEREHRQQIADAPAFCIESGVPPGEGGGLSYPCFLISGTSPPWTKDVETFDILSF